MHAPPGWGILRAAQIMTSGPAEFVRLAVRLMGDSTRCASSLEGLASFAEAVLLMARVADDEQVLRYSWPIMASASKKAFVESLELGLARPLPIGDSLCGLPTPSMTSSNISWT
mmetsp:Transcript_84989/g.225707  ORF Transcript_84989/g.225707 Transcript_84989/m.225707 type:complete len:114 (-) Transcript_84989:946-1287(-)